MTSPCLSRTTKSRRTSEVVVRRVGWGSCAGATRGRAKRTQRSFRMGHRPCQSVPPNRSKWIHSFFSIAPRCGSACAPGGEEVSQGAVHRRTRSHQHCAGGFIPDEKAAYRLGVCLQRLKNRVIVLSLNSLHKFRSATADLRHGGQAFDSVWRKKRARLRSG